MTKDEALKLALEALDKCKAALAEELGAWDIDPPLHHVQKAHDLCDPAITAIEQALAAPVQEQQPEPPSDENIFDAWVSACDSDGIAYDGPSFERGYRLGRGEYDEYTGALVAAAIKQAHPAPVQEPVGYQYQDGYGNWCNFLGDKHYRDTLASGKFAIRPIYTTPPAAQPAPVISAGPITPAMTQPISDDDLQRLRDLQYIFKDVDQCGPLLGMGAAPAAQPAPVQDLPFGVGGGLVAIKTLLSRDPCVHANTAIEMIDAILKEHPAAQRQWVGLTDEEIDEIFNNWPTYNLDHYEFGRVVVAKVFEKNSATAVVIPDALNPKDENPAYAAGWNDCRAEMLKGNT